MFKVTLMSSFVLLLLSGCAGSPEHRNRIITESAALIQPTQTKLSRFSKFKVLPMKSSIVIQNNAGKAQYASVVESKLNNRLYPVITEWEGKASSANRQLLIEPELLSLRIVSGGARFWIGAMAGSSDVKLRLTLRDARTKKVIGSPVISKNTGGMAGAWSSGATDRNLVDYIVDISKQYLINNY